MTSFARILSALINVSVLILDAIVLLIMIAKLVHNAQLIIVKNNVPLTKKLWYQRGVFAVQRPVLIDNHVVLLLVSRGVLIRLLLLVKLIFVVI